MAYGTFYVYDDDGNLVAEEEVEAVAVVVVEDDPGKEVYDFALECLTKNSEAELLADLRKMKEEEDKNPAWKKRRDKK